jgi:copper chaperone CopZ
MKCDGCVSSIEKALTELGVASVDVDLAGKSAQVETDLSVTALIDAVKSAGFDATEIS